MRSFKSSIGPAGAPWAASPKLFNLSGSMAWLWQGNVQQDYQWRDMPNHFLITGRESKIVSSLFFLKTRNIKTHGFNPHTYPALELQGMLEPIGPILGQTGAHTVQAATSWGPAQRDKQLTAHGQLRTTN